MARTAATARQARGARGAAPGRHAASRTVQSGRMITGAAFASSSAVGGGLRVAHPLAGVSYATSSAALLVLGTSPFYLINENGDHLTDESGNRLYMGVL